MYFIGINGYQNLVSAPIFNSLMLDSNKKVTNWILTGISSKKNKSFDTNPESTISNLANGRVILKSNVLLQTFYGKKIFFIAG